MRLAILGTDSTHARIFGELIGSQRSVLGDDVRVVSVWGQLNAEAQRTAVALGLAHASASIGDALHAADCAMVLGRFPESHKEPAQEALRRGIPTFVDKHFTSTTADAEELFALATSKGTMLCGGSALRYSNAVVKIKSALCPSDYVIVTGPARCVDMGNDYRFRHVAFYGSHAVDMLLEILGADIREEHVFAAQQSVSVLVRTGRGSGMVTLVDGPPEFYNVEHFSQVGVDICRVELDGSYNWKLLEAVIGGVQVGRSPIAPESTMAAVSLLEKMEAAYTARRQDS